MYEAIASPLNFLGKFRTGITNGWNNFVWFLVGLVNVWPFLLIALMLLGIFGIWKPRRRGKTSQQAQEKNNSERLIQK